MKELKFIAQASNTEPPCTVTVTKEENNLTARCTCPEGGVGHICRHRLSILSGDGRMIISDNPGDVRHVEAWVVWSDVGMLIARLADAQGKFQNVKEEAEKSAAAFDEAFEEVRTIERLLVKAIND